MTEYAKAGSQRWLQIAVNEQPTSISRSLNLGSGKNSINWASPSAASAFRELRDGAALRALGIGQLPNRTLSDFWPTRGPVWDGLARTTTGEVLLVEAKAHIPELASGETQASPASRVKIERSLKEVQKAIASRSQADWTRTFYQYTNRLAFLYLLRVLNGIPAHLVNVYFTNADDVNGPSSRAEWEGALALMHTLLGTSNHALKPFVHDVFIDVKKLVRVKSGV
ncbi:MAG: hypothetical protein WD942_01105 [Dehalococcoidia bacterium]